MGNPSLRSSSLGFMEKCVLCALPFAMLCAPPVVASGFGVCLTGSENQMEHKKEVRLLLPKRLNQNIFWTFNQKRINRNPILNRTLEKCPSIVLVVRELRRNVVASKPNILPPDPVTIITWACYLKLFSIAQCGRI